MLTDVASHAKEDQGKVKETRAQALFEAMKAVLKGLAKTYSDYEQGVEPDWRQ